ncbi:MAG TPA: hypothetical protein PL110_18840 [Candidatus Eremiobacteraeota bacterium]|nr:hypothetical protein [Candidatus Eremiobacteraeota bacterium]
MEPYYFDKGTGRRLLEKAREIGKKRNCSNILIGEGEDEQEAQKFYNLPALLT